LVKRAWFRSYPHGPGSEPGDMMVQSWDTAYKPGQQNDFSVCTTWLVRAGYEEAFLINIWRGRVDFPALVRKAEELSDFYAADLILVEDAGSGISLLQHLKEERHPVKAVKPQTDKVTRLSTGSTLIEGGRILLPGKPNDWLDDFMAELLAFPHGTHDDQVDSLSQFLTWMHDRRHPKNIATIGRYTW
jgi:predicted phage terminase large subunit-like protein